MYKCYEPLASCGPANVCHQMTFLATRSAARILIMNLHHRRGLPLTRPAVLLGEGRPDTRAVEIEHSCVRTMQGRTYLIKHRLFHKLLLHTYYKIAREGELQLNMGW